MTVTVIYTVPRNIFPVAEFLSRFTQDERITMRGSTVPEVVDFYQMLLLMDSIDVTSTFAIDGVSNLVTNNIIDISRVDIILGAL